MMCATCIYCVPSNYCPPGCYVLILLTSLTSRYERQRRAMIFYFLDSFANGNALRSTQDDSRSHHDRPQKLSNAYLVSIAEDSIEDIGISLAKYFDTCLVPEYEILYFDGPCPHFGGICICALHYPKSVRSKKHTINNTTNSNCTYRSSHGRWPQ